MARPPDRPMTVSAEAADLRERMMRMETMQTQMMEMLREHMTERKLSTVALEASRVMAEEKHTAVMTLMSNRIQKVEDDLLEYRVGGKILFAVGAAGLSISAAVGALMMKLGVVLGWIKPT